MSKKPFTNVTIEKVQRSDLEQLEKLFATAFAGEIDIQQIKRRIRRARQFYYILQPLSKFSGWVKNHFDVYAVKIAGQVVGFMQLSYLNSAQLHIDYIAFSKQHRGQGLGRWVLTKLLETVADANNQDVVLEVRVDNPAYKLYQRLGFRAVTEILHYEMIFGGTTSSLPSLDDELPGFRVLTVKDRGQLYRLYKASVPPGLRRVIKRSYREFNPSMLVRHLDWAKNYLMRKQISNYVVEQSDKIVALVTISSYVKTQNHIISLIIHHSYEYLRSALLKKAINLIEASYKQGVISCTIYSDDSNKQAVLEQLGFKRDSAYYLMLYPAAQKRKETVKARSQNAAASKSMKTSL
ncbi:ribosomal-protein-alanine N-acetyltransferase [Sporomusa ovata DSM 2662]|uniref:GCN5-related N-acetyltransferase n=1 Tax=Sporomusa ovata TaxID=2378 RepID=A0A0U1KYA4_9FIRM|nr:GNAT family N-acetyltransferase [Sporomusa ovata]EQB28968.1 acetyltransferase [Sporomusa ovata DSM 2662]CQR72398.1 GCN5-related N-acetyltransferase [Sporomusa ovata]